MKKTAIVCLLLSLTVLALAAAKVNPPGRLTAKDAHQHAMRRAYGWDKGCKLIIVAARPFDFDLDGKSSRWGYRCVSGDGKNCAVFSFNWAHPDSPVRRAKAKRPVQCLDTINDVRWRIDSPKACDIAKRNRLSKWLAEHPSFSAAYSRNRFELVANKSDGPYWLINLAAKVSEKPRKYDHIEMRISAVDGHIISSQAESRP